MLLTRPDIRPPEAIDGPWMTAVLNDAGLDVRVDRVTAQPVGTGQIGDSVRFHLEYGRKGPGAPASLVGKFPAAGPESRATGVALGNYLREVRFYQQLAAGALIRTPRCYFAEVDEQTHDFVLMLEDLAPAQPGDQLRGVTLDQARLVVVEAARLHASHWGDARLDTLPWVSGSAAAPSGMVTEEMVMALWAGFKDRYRDRLKPRWTAVGDDLARRFKQLGESYDGPRCLTHNDFRPDNMMFATPAGGYPVTVLDWQSFAYGAGAVDVAYFLAGALPAKTLERHEPELLELYLRTLEGLGVKGYPMADLERHYAQGAYLLFATAFFAAMIVTRTERGDRMFLQMLGSAAEHLHRHEAAG
ncbi:ecdysteroid 22-kinase family protein [Phenylobacterium sp. J367]|uniref:ecdysteroid 22-kinase family protein n=1 Tax=Phenylobacterium sp. J367 TaxID=2898435 RepID=UPI00215163C9|nr:ecdysteroid 22-kinase family protein [Phenylobacterium sp. J367]MCR5878516.1 ecdysteroid 22-kinase family protein [Phenylobacterium sp. J367]